MSIKDIARKPFFVYTGQDVRDVHMYVRTDVPTRVMLYAPPIINGGGIKKIIKMFLFSYPSVLCVMFECQYHMFLLINKKAP